jgi:peptidoglycan/LPS O-acetylase OafA/YrhL
LKTGMNNKFLKLEALRGLAAFYVVLHHTLPHVYVVGGVNVGLLVKFGQEAVILFFILSGFVINYSFRLKKINTFKKYFFSRFFRIYIPLVPVLLISYLNYSYIEGAWQNPDIGVLIGNLFMLQDWSFARPNVIVDAYMGNGPLWTLSYEWWFYMLFYPLVTTNLSKPTRDVVVYGTCIAAAMLYVIWPFYPIRVVMYLAIWWTGVRLSDAYIDSELSAWRNVLLPFAALLSVCCLLAFKVFIQKQQGVNLLLGIHPIIELRHFVFAVAALSIALMWRRVGWVGFNALVGPFVVLAPISYTLYIVHSPLAQYGTYLDAINNTYVEWVGYLAISIAVSYLIELKIYPVVRKRLYPMFVK